MLFLTFGMAMNSIASAAAHEKLTNYFMDHAMQSGKKLIYLYEDSSTLYVRLYCSYLNSNLPEFFIKKLIGYTHDELGKEIESILDEMMTDYMHEVQCNGMSRSIDLESILLSSCAASDNMEHSSKSIFEKIKKSTAEKFNITIKESSMQEMDSMAEDVDLIFTVLPFYYFSDFTPGEAKNVSHLDHQVSFIFWQTAKYLEKIILFLNKVDSVDCFFNNKKYFSKSLNKLIFDFCLMMNFNMSNILYYMTLPDQKYKNKSHMLLESVNYQKSVSLTSLPLAE